MKAFDKREVDGVTYQINITYDGRFSTTYDDDEISSKTLDKLLARLRSLMRKRKVTEKAALPVTVLGGRGYYYNKEEEKFRHGVVTGIHASNNNILFKQDGGKQGTEQLSGYNNVYRRLTDAEMAEYIKLVRAQEAAREAVENWDKEHRIDVQKELGKIEEAAGIEKEKSPLERALGR